MLLGRTYVKFCCVVWPHGRSHRADMDALAFARLVTQTFSSCGHGCSGHSHALVTRTFSSRGHGCFGHSHALVTRTFSSCGVKGFTKPRDVR